jgi:hypothetical protein
MGSDNGERKVGADNGERKVNPKWPAFIRTLGAFLFSWNPKLALVPNETSKIYSTWFLSPEQHAAELLLYVVLHAYPIFNIVVYGVPGWDLEYPKRESDPIMETVDAAVFVTFCASFAATINYKYHRNRLWFLWCPCHAFTIICLVVGSSRSYLSAWLFNFYLHQCWGSWLGILAADLRDYTDNMEIFNFFLQHVLLCVFPLYHIARQTYPIFPTAVMDNFSMYHVFHWAVLFPISIFSGWHMNYMTHPPTQAKFAGNKYRLLMAPFTIFLTYLTREIFIGAWLRQCEGSRLKNIALSRASPHSAVFALFFVQAVSSPGSRLPVFLAFSCS